MREHCKDPAQWRVQASSEAVLRLKYLAPGEHALQEVQARVAHALSAAEGTPGSHNQRRWESLFLQALRSGFLPGGRIVAAAGREPHRCWMSCFVLPLGGPRGRADDAMPCLQEALAQARSTLERGGGVGMDFSACEEVLQALQAVDFTCEDATHRTGRRGALMGVLCAEHPRWLEFITAKACGGLSHFNLSVGLCDAFMHRVQTGEAEAMRRWRALVQSAWATGGPGVLFLDAVQRDDSLAWRERLVATNPCGEQPLPPYGSCCLGSLDLTRFVQTPFENSARIDLQALASVAAVAVRMLDNVISLSAWPLPQQQQEARATRRIGLGFTGLGDALAMLGLRYDRPEGRRQAARIAQTLRDAAVRASAALALERGPYPLFDARRHLAPPGFASRLPTALQALIRRQGLRNSHLLCVAPAGSISLALADNVSSGVEPVWAWQHQRAVRGPAGEVQTLRFEDHAWRLWQRHEGHGPDAPLPGAFLCAQQIAPADQVAMVAAIAPFIDGGISKTVHLPADSTPHEVAQVFTQAWRRGLKGITVFRTGCETQALLQPTACER